MSLPEVEERYNKSISALKSLEQILKALDASYDVHITRLSWLKHLADASVELKRLEVEAIRSAQIAAQVAQQQAQRALAQQQAQQQVLANEESLRTSQSEQVMPVSQPEQETTKKSRKKAE